jgi:hypothetical protein
MPNCFELTYWSILEPVRPLRTDMFMEDTEVLSPAPREAPGFCNALVIGIEVWDGGLPRPDALTFMLRISPVIVFGENCRDSFCYYWAVLIFK